MNSFLAKLVQRGLVGALPLYAACSCDPVLVVRNPATLSSATIPISPTKDECKQICGENVQKCERIVVTDAPMTGFAHGADPKAQFTIACTMPRYCPGGRRPPGLCDAPVVAGVGAHFAELARLEAASVHAFVELARELALHGAPREIIAAVRRAAIEEIRHAQLAGFEARRFGGEVEAPEVIATPPRSLADVLVDNAIEGLVHERYGAALAAVRADRTTGSIRRTMSEIAVDEAGHAELAEAIHAWGMTRSTGAQRRRIVEARERTIDELRAVLDVEPTADLATIGMPSATLATELLAAVAA